MCYGLAAAGNKSAMRPPLPPLGFRGEWKETGRNWWVGIRQFNRSANKGNRNNNDTDKEKTQHKLQSPESRSPRLLPLRAPEMRVPATQLPPTRTQHDGTWYGIPCSVWPGGVSPPGCVPSWILVKINPLLAKPRTKCKLNSAWHREKINYGKVL